MYKTAAIITLILISLLSLRSLIILGKPESVIIRTVTAEHSEASSATKSYSLDFVRDSGHTSFLISSDLKQGRVDVKVYDDKGKYIFTEGAEGKYSKYYALVGRIYKAGYKIEVIEKDVIGSYKYEVTQLPPISITGWTSHFMLFGAFMTSSLALLIYGWWMLSQRRKHGQTTAHSPA